MSRQIDGKKTLQIVIILMKTERKESESFSLFKKAFDIISAYSLPCAGNTVTPKRANLNPEKVGGMCHCTMH